MEMEGIQCEDEISLAMVTANLEDMSTKPGKRDVVHAKAREVREVPDGLSPAVGSGGH